MPRRHDGAPRRLTLDNFYLASEFLLLQQNSSLLLITSSAPNHQIHGHRGPSPSKDLDPTNNSILSNSKDP
jgi:hypothetical protein